MSSVGDAVLFGPSGALCTSTWCKVGSFREEEEPHGIRKLVQLLKSSCHSGAILLPVPLQENELIELHAPSQYWDLLERFLQDDVQPSMHAVAVSYPPQIQPVGVDLVVRDENKSLWKIKNEVAIDRLEELATDRCIAGHNDLCWRECLSQGHGK